MMRQYASALKFISEIIERGIKEHPGQYLYSYILTCPLERLYHRSQKCHFVLPVLSILTVIAVVTVIQLLP